MCLERKQNIARSISLVLYVDNILLFGNNKIALNEIKDLLSTPFSMKRLREAAYTLGVRIYIDRSNQLLGLSQSMYIDKMLRILSMEQSKHG